MSDTQPSPRPKDTRRLERTKVPGIYRRGNRYVVVGRDQRGRQVKRYAATMAEARDRKAELRTDVARGEYRPKSQTLFTEYATEWAETYNGRTSRGLKPQTRDDYKAAVGRTEFVDHFRRRRLSEIVADDLISYGEALKKKGLSPRTVRNLVLPLRLCLADALERGHLRSNPIAGVKVAAAQGRGADKKRALETAEVEKLLEAFDDLAAEVAPKSSVRAKTIREVRFLTRFLLLTGCRVGEALALQWGDFEDGLAHVHITKRVYKDGFGDPKSAYGIRTIPIAQELRTALRRHRGSADEKAHVFAAGGGSRLDYTTTTRAFRQAADRAGLDWATVHTCRHTLASWLLRPSPAGLGASAQQAQLWLGHHAAAFTLDTYSHFMPKHLPNPDALAALLGATDGATRATETRRNRRHATTAKTPRKAA